MTMAAQWTAQCVKSFILQSMSLLRERGGERNLLCALLFYSWPGSCWQQQWPWQVRRWLVSSVHSHSTHLLAGVRWPLVRRGDPSRSAPQTMVCGKSVQLTTSPSLDRLLITLAALCLLVMSGGHCSHTPGVCSVCLVLSTTEPWHQTQAPCPAGASSGASEERRNQLPAHGPWPGQREQTQQVRGISSTGDVTIRVTSNWIDLKCTLIVRELPLTIIISEWEQPSPTSSTHHVKNKITIKLRKGVHSMVHSFIFGSVRSSRSANLCSSVWWKFV